ARTVGAGAGSVVGFCSDAGAGSVAIFAPTLVGVDSPERVPYQMPTASANAAAPAAKGTIGNRRVPGPMTTGAIETATCAGRGAVGAGGGSITAGPCSTMRRNSA